MWIPSYEVISIAAIHHLNKQRRTDGVGVVRQESETNGSRSEERLSSSEGPTRFYPGIRWALQSRETSIATAGGPRSNCLPSTGQSVLGVLGRARPFRLTPDQILSLQWLSLDPCLLYENNIIILFKHNQSD